MSERERSRWVWLGGRRLSGHPSDVRVVRNGEYSAQPAGFEVFGGEVRRVGVVGPRRPGDRAVHPTRWKSDR